MKLTLVVNGETRTVEAPGAERLLDKLRGEQEEVEWTEEAISENRRRRWLARTGILINFVLVLLIGAWFVYTRFVAPSS